MALAQHGKHPNTLRDRFPHANREWGGVWSRVARSSCTDASRLQKSKHEMGQPRGVAPVSVDRFLVVFAHISSCTGGPSISRMRIVSKLPPEGKICIDRSLQR